MELGFTGETVSSLEMELPPHFARSAPFMCRGGNDRVTQRGPGSDVRTETEEERQAAPRGWEGTRTSRVT